jgi:hypothetical protein
VSKYLTMKNSPLSRLSKNTCYKNMVEQSKSNNNLRCNDQCDSCEFPHFFAVKKRFPINPISRKRAREIVKEKPVREVLNKRANGCCEWCGRPAWQCLGGLHPHEVKKRSSGGKISLSNSVWVCNTCQGIKGHNLRIVEEGHKFKEDI